jgi:hypothetical protein
MKEACLTHLRISYPKGVDTAQQHRDIIRIFAIGYAAGMQATKGNITVELDTELKRLADMNWWPDESWVWWKASPILLTS